ncbi:hypothetical protein ACSFBM_00140 [Variovorax sp. GB1R11]|uniref:hypothetical protein n=1 Tax=Variovorax sp. GB1R11 TaxID=3443741 RepID=UPI003F45DA1B
MALQGLFAASQQQHDSLFAGGPPTKFFRCIGVGRWPLRHRAAMVAAVGWLPLVLLAVLSLLDGEHQVWHAFWRDASVHARSLIVAPLLVLAEGICIPRLGAIGFVFRQRQLVPASQEVAYNALLRKIGRLRDLRWLEIVAVGLAFSAALLVAQNVPPSFLPDWHRGNPAMPLGRSLASWWHTLVSLPLLLILLLGWIWRWTLWIRFLWGVSRLELRLVAAHPDGAAGLLFVSFSLRAFSILGLAIGVLVAATTLAHVWAGTPGSVELLATSMLGTLAFVLAGFAAPVLIFSGKLIDLWHRSNLLYGALAQSAGMAFEDNWMSQPLKLEAQKLLGSNEASALADLHQVVQGAGALRLLPVDLRSLIILAAATALPFAVIALALVPMDRLLSHVLKFFL